MKKILNVKVDVGEEEISLKIEVEDKFEDLSLHDKDCLIEKEINKRIYIAWDYAS